MHYTDIEVHLAREREERRRRRERVDAFLNAARFCSAALAAMASRHEYSDSARQLLAHTGRSGGKVDAFDILHSNLTPSALRLRASVWSAYIANDNRNHGALTQRQLAAVDNLENSSSPAARLARALLGDLPCWRTASRECRAAYALGHLVRSRRDGGAS